MGLSGVARTFHRGLHQLRSTSIPSGAIFTVMRNPKQVITTHPMETELETYRKTLKEEVFTACSEAPPLIPRYKQRVLQLMEHTTPIITEAMSFGVELGYRSLVPKNLQTDENLHKMRILRGAFELRFTQLGELIFECCAKLKVPSVVQILTMGALLDDIADKTVIKLGKPAWHTICPGGEDTAIFDGLCISHFCLYLVHKYFKEHKNYPHLLYTLSETSRQIGMGEVLDILGRGQVQDEKEYFEYTDLKTGSPIRCAPRLGLLLAGVTDEAELDKVDQIFIKMGLVYQIWDDFLDYYCSVETTGKSAKNDIKRCATSWASLTGLKRFNDDQKDVFWSCYGSDIPEKVSTVVKLYDDINLSQLYVDEMQEIYKETEVLIKDLKDERIAAMCTGYIDWIIGRPS